MFSIIEFKSKYYKKEAFRLSMNNDNFKRKKRSNRSNDCNNDNKKYSTSNNEDGLGLASLSYAEYIILASTLAYSLSEELSESDLALLVAFLYIVLADLEIIIAKNQIKQGSSTTSEDEEEEIDLGSDIITQPININSKKRRYKGKKKKYR